MAEQIPYGITQNLLTMLGSNLVQEIGLMYGVRGELRKLENTLSTVAAVLLDAEEQQETSHAVAVWVRRLKDVVYDADDLLDDFATEELRRETDLRGRFGIGQVSDFFSSSNHLAFRFKMGHRIKAIRESLDDVANHISKFNFISGVISDAPIRKRWRETCSVAEKSHKIVGREENKKEIIELLMQSSSSQENLSMVVIVGMGGLGKTTLAQLVYNDQGAANYFGLKMWVCVSDDFNVKVLIRNIIKSATDIGVEDVELDQLQKKLKQCLRGKRYLLVLDDVWNEDKKKWGQFITLLPVGAHGSKILATTRSTRVASVMGIDSPYIVKGLRDDESWELFRSVAFKNEEQMHPNLVVIGKEIVKMCKGVPLVIETIGGILFFKTQESHWLSIKNNENLVLLGDKNDIFSVLRLSYDNLPIHLKQCFTYCALFPKDYKIRKRELVQLWMAQGFIQPSHENKHLEEVGDEYFEDLLARSLFQEGEEKHVNQGHCYKMHDLIHDLAQSIAKSEVIILTGDVKTVPKRIHHMSLFQLHQMPRDVMGKPIRTLYMGYCGGDHYKINRFISSLKYSRAMRVRSHYHTVVASLAKLTHLRYLDLSYGNFENLPNAFTTLKNVQTLKLVGCYRLKEWPRNMKKLINLRHLEIDKCDRLSYMPRGLGESTKLQTLSFFRVGNDSWRCRHKKRIGGLSELKFLNNLKGKLIIERLAHVRSCEAEGAILDGKQYLECLRLDWRWGRSAEATKEGEEEEEAVLQVSVMESLQPHQNLKELFIEGYEGVRFPNWMMNDRLDLQLPNLVKIEMLDCKRCLVLPPFGQLPSLKLLCLWDLDAVEYMEDYPLSAKPFFPSLKTLKIHNMPNLKGWGIRDVAVEQALPYPYLEDLHLELIRMELCLPLICASSSLKSIEIADVENLISLPQGLRHLSTLQTLAVLACKNLESLPESIGYLTSLAELKINFCPKLTSLPKEMRSLRNLHTLEICNCLYLSERCRKRTGEDWPKISHIPNIFIQ